jgi:hypothetical protein
MLGRFDEKDNRVVLFTPSRKSTQAQSVAYFQDATGQLLSAQLRARIPANGRLIIDYARWNTSRPTGLRAWVQAKGKKTKVKVSVTDDA